MRFVFAIITFALCAYGTYYGVIEEWRTAFRFMAGAVAVSSAELLLYSNSNKK